MQVTSWISVSVAVTVAALALVALRSVGGGPGSEVAPDSADEAESVAAAAD